MHETTNEDGKEAIQQNVRSLTAETQNLQPGTNNLGPRRLSSPGLYHKLFPAEASDAKSVSPRKINPSSKEEHSDCDSIPWHLFDVALELQAPWGEQLVRGEKTIETRAYSLPTRLIGRKIVVLQSNPGKDCVSSLPAQVKANHPGMHAIGTVVFSKVIEYKTEDQWSKDEGLHLVTTGSAYGWKKDSTTVIYGWVVGQTKMYIEKRPVPDLVRKYRSLFQIQEEMDAKDRQEESAVTKQVRFEEPVVEEFPREQSTSTEVKSKPVQRTSRGKWCILWLLITYILIKAFLWLFTPVSLAPVVPVLTPELPMPNVTTDETPQIAIKEQLIVTDSQNGTSQVLLDLEDQNDRVQPTIFQAVLLAKNATHQEGTASHSKLPQNQTQPPTPAPVHPNPKKNTGKENITVPEIYKLKRETTIEKKVDTHTPVVKPAELLVAESEMLGEKLKKANLAVKMSTDISVEADIKHKLPASTASLAKDKNPPKETKQQSKEDLNFTVVQEHVPPVFALKTNTSKNELHVDSNSSVAIPLQCDGPLNTTVASGANDSQLLKASWVPKIKNETGEPTRLSPSVITAVYDKGVASIESPSGNIKHVNFSEQTAENSVSALNNTGNASFGIAQVPHSSDRAQSVSQLQNNTLFEKNVNSSFVSPQNSATSIPVSMTANQQGNTSAELSREESVVRTFELAHLESKKADKNQKEHEVHVGADEFIKSATVSVFSVKNSENSSLPVLKEHVNVSDRAAKNGVSTAEIELDFSNLELQMHATLNDTGNDSFSVAQVSQPSDETQSVSQKNTSFEKNVDSSFVSPQYSATNIPVSVTANELGNSSSGLSREESIVGTFEFSSLESNKSDQNQKEHKKATDEFKIKPPTASVFPVENSENSSLPILKAEPFEKQQTQKSSQTSIMPTKNETTLHENPIPHVHVEAPTSYGSLCSHTLQDSVNAATAVFSGVQMNQRFHRGYVLKGETSIVFLDKNCSLVFSGCYQHVSAQPVLQIWHSTPERGIKKKFDYFMHKWKEPECFFVLQKTALRKTVQIKLNDKKIWVSKKITSIQSLNTFRMVIQANKLVISNNADVVITVSPPA